MQVDSELDLVDAAFAVQQDNVERVQAWTDAAQLGPVSDDRAREWIEADASL